MTADRLPVLVEEDVWPEFSEAVRALGERWTTPDGSTTYDLRFDADARRLEVYGPDDDAALLELAKAVHDAAGGVWSGDAVHETATIWGM